MIMKRNLFIGAIAIAILVGTGFKVKDKAAFNMAKFNWEETVHDFGKIEQGVPVSTEFKFTNTGNVPLVITQVQGSCGCTVTDYTKEAVAPGKEGMVKATFNAARMGAFNKTVRVTANIEGGTETLTIKGEVVAKSGEASKES